MVEVGRVEAGLYLTDKGFDSGLASAGSKLDTFGSKVDSVAQKAGQIGQSLTMGLTLPIAGAAAGVVKLAGDFEQSMANVASVTGGGVEAQKALSAAAREAGATTVFSASQAADAMYFMASAGWKDQQIIAGLNDTLKLAAAGGKDLAFTSDLMTATISQFGLEAGDAGRVANVFAAATSNSQANLDKLAYSMRYVGPVAQSLGWSLEETTGGLMGLYNAGFKGEQAGTVLRGALSALLKPSDAAAETLKTLGLSIEDVNPATHSLAEIIGVLESKNLSAAQAVAIFGQEAGPGMLALLGQGQDALEGYTESITGTSKASEMMATQTNTLWGALKQLRSAGEELALVFGDVLIPPLTDLVNDTITPFVRKLGEMDSGTVKLIATIAGLAAVVGPVLIGFSLMLPAITLVAGAMAAILSPIGLVTAAFVALAGYEVYKHFDLITSAIGKVKTAASDLFGALREGNIDEAFDILRTAADDFVGYLMDIDWGDLYKSLQSETRSAFKKAVSVAKSVWSGLSGIGNDVASWIRDVDWRGVWDTVIIGATSAFGALRDLGSYVVEGLRGIDWGSAWEDIKGVAGYILDELEAIDWGAVGETIRASLSGIWEGITDLGSQIRDSFLAVDWGAVGSTVAGLIGGGFAALMNIGAQIKTSLQAVDWSDIGDRMVSGIQGALTALSSLGSTIADKIRDVNWAGVGQTIISGIQGAISAASGLASSLAEKFTSYGGWGAVGDKIVSTVKTVLGAASDLGETLSDKIESYGGWRAIGEKIVSEAKMVFSTAVDLATTIADKITGWTGWGGVGDTIRTGITGAWETFTGWHEAIKTRLGDWADSAGPHDVGEKIGVAIADAIRALPDIAKSIGQAISDFFTSGGAGTDDNFFSIGLNIISGVFSGMMDGLAPLGAQLKAGMIDIFLDIMESLPYSDRFFGDWIEGQRTANEARWAQANAAVEAQDIVRNTSWTSAFGGGITAAREEKSALSQLGITAGEVERSPGGSYYRMLTGPGGSEYNLPTYPAGYAKVSSQADVAAIVGDLLVAGFTKADIPKILSEVIDPSSMPYASGYLGSSEYATQLAEFSQTLTTQNEVMIDTTSSLDTIAKTTLPKASNDLLDNFRRVYSGFDATGNKISSGWISSSGVAQSNFIQGSSAALSALQTGGWSALRDLTAGGEQTKTTLIDTSNAVALSQLSTSETVTSGWISSSAAARQNILSGSQTFYGDVYSSGNIWKDAADWAAASQKSASSEAGSGWKSDVETSGQTIQSAADAIGNAGGVFIGSMGSLMSSLARVVGSGGGITYTAGGGTTSGTGYSYSSGGMCGELGPPMHGYNALIYTAPSGEVYAINPMTFQSVGGISGAISSGSATKLTTSKSSGGSLSYSSGWLKSAPKSKKAIVTNYGTWGSYAEGGVAVGPQLAVVGDNPSGREAIIPEEVWGDKGGNGGDVTVIVEMDSRQIAKAVMPRAAKSIRIRTNAKVN